MSWLRWINYRGFWRLILFTAFFLSILLTIIQSGGIALALRTSSTVTPQSMTTTVITAEPTMTSEPEVGGQVGENAALVCGAVLLVIIIIAGMVRGARWMSYRGDNGKGKTE